MQNGFEFLTMAFITRARAVFNFKHEVVKFHKNFKFDISSVTIVGRIKAARWL